MFFKTHSSVSWERAVLSGLTGLKNNVRMQSELRIKGSAPYAFHGALHYHYIKYNIYIESPSCACFVSSILCFGSFCCTCNHFVKPVLSCTICTTSPIGRRWKPDVTWDKRAWGPSRNQSAVPIQTQSSDGTKPSTPVCSESCSVRKLLLCILFFLSFLFLRSFASLEFFSQVFWMSRTQRAETDGHSWLPVGDEPGSKVRLC